MVSSGDALIWLDMQTGRSCLFHNFGPDENVTQMEVLTVEFTGDTEDKPTQVLFVKTKLGKITLFSISDSVT